jgi:hypothetical protein
MRNREGVARLFYIARVSTHLLAFSSWGFQLGVSGASGVFDVGVVGGRFIM